MQGVGRNSCCVHEWGGEELKDETGQRIRIRNYKNISYSKRISEIIKKVLRKHNKKVAFPTDMKLHPVLPSTRRYM